MIEIAALASSSRGNAYLVSDGSSPLLLECGVRIQAIRRRTGYGMSSLAGCLLSHEHKDHARAVKDMLKAGVDCYMSAGTAEALGLEGHRVHVVRSLEQFRVGSWTVLPFDTIHDAPEPLGFLLASGGAKVLYATDTAYIRYRFRGLTHLMLECNFALDIARENVAQGLLDVEVKNRIVKNHFSLENVKGFLRANDHGRVEGIWLLHLSDGNSDAERFKREIQGLTGKPVYVANA